MGSVDLHVIFEKTKEITETNRNKTCVIRKSDTKQTNKCENESRKETDVNIP